MKIFLPIFFGVALIGCDFHCDGELCDGEFGHDCLGEDVEGREDPLVYDTADPDEEPQVLLAMTPSFGEQGETFIASITGDLDGEVVSGVEFFGDLEVLAEDIRPNETLLTISIPAEAALGTVDLLVELESGMAIYLDAAFEIFEAGSGNTAGGSGEGLSDPCD